MINRQEKKNIFNNLAEAIENTAQQKLNVNPLPLTIYKDGIGFKNYSVRLSNFSLNNIPNNCARILTWSLSLGGCLGLINYETFNKVGLSSSDQNTHYMMHTHGFSSDSIIASIVNSISQGQCNVVYDPSRQVEYWPLNWLPIYQLEKNIYSAGLARGLLQPINLSTEKCLAKLLNETYSTFLALEEEEVRLKKEALDQAVGQATPYIVAGLGLFGACYQSYKIYKRYKKNKPLNFTQRLDKIYYQGDIDEDFICPIWKTVMNDPVITNDGFIYDRLAIETWYTHNATSPIDPSTVIMPELIQPNSELKKQIEAFVSACEQEYLQRTSNRRNNH